MGASVNSLGKGKYSVSVSALASGSSGNSYLVEAEGIKVLFDAGLDASRLESYLRSMGATAADLSAIFVTHEHIDHVRGAGLLSRRHKLPVVASEGTFSGGVNQFGFLPEKLVQPPGTEVTLGSILVRSFAISHDALEPCGFWIEIGGYHIVLCTDLGCETESIREPLQAADLLVLESNHDLDKLWRGRYPPMLKRRVAGPHGHLSNADASRLIFETATGSSGPSTRTVWLAHLSAANNTPDLALDAASKPLTLEGCTHVEVKVLARDRPSHTWHAEYEAAVVEGAASV